MKRFHLVFGGCLVLVAMAGMTAVEGGDRSMTTPTAGALLADQLADTDCKRVTGRLEETLIHPVGAPNDPIGRILGEVRGSLNGSETAILTTLGPGPDGTLLADTVNVFVTGPGDSLAATGLAVFTPISETDVKDDVILTILPDESTGKYHGATGTIQLTGVGFNLFPSAAPGETTFIFRYRGEICRPESDRGDGDDDDDDDG